MTLPSIPQKEGVDRNWSPETWRAGLDEAVRLAGYALMKTWDDVVRNFGVGGDLSKVIIAHATTLLDAGIVKPVAREAAVLLAELEGLAILTENGRYMALNVIQSALDKARSGE